MLLWLTVWCNGGILGPESWDRSNTLWAPIWRPWNYRQGVRNRLGRSRVPVSAREASKRVVIAFRSCIFFVLNLPAHVPVQATNKTLPAKRNISDDVWPTKGPSDILAREEKHVRCSKDTTTARENKPRLPGADCGSLLRTLIVAPNRPKTKLFNPFPKLHSLSANKYKYFVIIEHESLDNPQALELTGSWINYRAKQIRNNRTVRGGHLMHQIPKRPAEQGLSHTPRVRISDCRHNQ